MGENRKGSSRAKARQRCEATARRARRKPSHPARPTISKRFKVVKPDK